jgi:site-specific DNA-methyltransferase (adenine-specific)
MVSVNKGDWDKSNGYEEDYLFDKSWIFACRNKLKSNGTIWISGTYHNIFSVARCLAELGFKILNCITWEKTNPPPNLSCKYFTHSAEYILWARKEQKVSHYFNYELMKIINGGTQMRDVWRLPAIAPWEKSCGKHPTQKPLCVLSRIIQASTLPGAWILDPFTGSSTTGIAANLLGRRFLGIDQNEEFLELSKERREEINDISKRTLYLEKLQKQAQLFEDKEIQTLNEPLVEYGQDLPF